jgi:hypothetical protein
MRHLQVTLNSNSYGEGFDEDGDEYADDFAEEEDQNERIGTAKSDSRKKNKPVMTYEPLKKEPPSAEVKHEMRMALFGFLDAARIDEMQLEEMYERAREEGGKAAEIAADKLFQTQKANVTALLKMIKDYHPSPSATVWINDPDFPRLAQELNLPI